MSFDLAALIHMQGSAVLKFRLILFVSVLPYTWQGGGNSLISAAQCNGVLPLIPYTHLSCANTNGDCYTPFSIK